MVIDCHTCSPSRYIFSDPGGHFTSFKAARLQYFYMDHTHQYIFYNFNYKINPILCEIHRILSGELLYCMRFKIRRMIVIFSYDM